RRQRVHCPHSAFCVASYERCLVGRRCVVVPLSPRANLVGCSIRRVGGGVSRECRYYRHHIARTASSLAGVSSHRRHCPVWDTCLTASAWLSFAKPLKATGLRCWRS